MTTCTTTADCSVAGGICVDKVEVGVPRKYRAGLLAICDEIRISLHRRTLPNPICARILILEGAKARTNRETATATRDLVKDTVRTALADLVADFPLDLPPQATCGDGTLDTEFGEECDDGNTDNGDGCSGSCLNE